MKTSHLCVSMCRILIEHLQKSEISRWPQTKYNAKTGWPQFAGREEDNESSFIKNEVEDSGYVIPGGYERLVEWYRKGLDSGNEDARKILDEMLGDGCGVPRDRNEALRWLHESAEHSGKDTQFRVAELLEFGFGRRDSEGAFKLYRKAADLGHPHAMDRLARMYEEGRTVPRNVEEFVAWYNKAAEYGVDNAQLKMGMLIEEGIHIPRAYKEAIKWYKKAARSWNAHAMFNLGLIYAQGKGVPRDYSRAHMWFGVAGTRRNDKAIKCRYAVAREMTSSQLPEAHCRLGEMYMQGLYVRGDYIKAIWWFEKAIEGGCKRAQFNMGLLYAQGKATRQNYVKAHMWFNLASSDGNKIATNCRHYIEKIMTSSQISKAQDLVKDCASWSGKAKETELQSRKLFSHKQTEG